jgi:hypothetical protein
MINTYTCIPNQTSSETVFADLKTFFEDKWTWSKIETNYPDSESTDYNTLTFWIDNTTYFRIMFDPAKSKYWAGCGEYNPTNEKYPYSDYVSFTYSKFDSIMLYTTSQGLLILFESEGGDYTLSGAIAKMKKLSDDTEITGFFTPTSNSGHQGAKVTSSYNMFSQSLYNGGTNLVPQVDFNIPLNSTVEGQYAAKTDGIFYVYMGQDSVFPADGTVVKFTMNGVKYVGNCKMVLADYS